MAQSISAGMLDVTRRIAAINALLEVDPAAGAASDAAAAGSDFASTLSSAMAAAQAASPGAGVPAQASALASTALAAAAAQAPAAAAIPDPASIPAGFALVPLSAVGLGAAPAATPTALAAPTPSASAVAVPASAVPAPSAQGAQRVALAAAEIGIAESPPGSNDAPRIAEYRTATTGSGVGPWCAYFTSWIGAQAGTPLGPGGQGEGYVPHMADWLRSEGRYATPEQATPRPGDLVMFDWERDGELDHIGLVQSVGADGRVYTIEGNADGLVKQRSYRPDQIAGYGLLP